MIETKFVRDGNVIKEVSGRWHPNISFAFQWKTDNGDTRTTIRCFVYDDEKNAYEELIDDLEFALSQARIKYGRMDFYDD